MDNLKSLFTNRSKAAAADFNVGAFVNDLALSAEQHGGALAINPALAQRVSTEGFGELNQEDASAAQDIYSDLERRLEGLGFESYNSKRGADGQRVGENQVLAASMAAIACGDEVRYKKALRAMGTLPASTNPNVINAAVSLSGPFGSVATFTDSIGLENYNEKSNRDFRVVTVGHNLTAARQDAFGEALYPTSVVNPQEGGVVQVLPYAAVMKDVFHAVTGQKMDAQEVNMVEAYRDPSILEDTSTSLIPVVDDQGKNVAAFVAAADVAPSGIETEQGGVLQTAPLKIGAKFDLIGISNRNQLIAGNVLDISDTIDPALKLKSVIVKLNGLAADGTTPETKVVRFTVERMPSALFQPALIGDTRAAQLNFVTEDLVLNGDSKGIDGSKSNGMTELATRGWTVRLALNVNGTVSLSKGDAWVNATPVVVEKLIDNATGQALDKTAGDGATVLAALGEMTVIGYELDAKFTNTNRRQRGHLVQTRALQFRYAIPMHAPITLPLSTIDEQGPGEVVKALTVGTNLRNSNNAVTRLMNYAAQLREVVGMGYDKPKFGAVEGALSAMIRPTYRYQKLDLTTAIDTLTSSNRYADVCAAILNVVKSQLFPAYRDSNIEAAFQTITGNADERPKFILATDKEIANYLMVAGDDRTLGAHLKYDIVSTNNSRMDGKLYVVPTRENPVENDILSFGQFYYVPTIVADLPISRNGQISREIAAVPFNLHVNNIPFVIEIDVVGLKQVMGESQFNGVLGTP
jgi:hypothetical protein